MSGGSTLIRQLDKKSRRSDQPLLFYAISTFKNMLPNQQYVDVEIDKLTNAIENVRTGDSFPTDILFVDKGDLKGVTKLDFTSDVRTQREWK